MATVEAKSILQNEGKFWLAPLAAEDIYFISSPDSTEFLYFLYCLENSIVVGLDTEWKPCFTRKGSMPSPRISILQIASCFSYCPDSWNRFRTSNLKPFSSIGSEKDLDFGQELLEQTHLNDESPKEESDTEKISIEDMQTAALNSFSEMRLKEIGTRTVGNERVFEKEAVFILDMLHLPAWAFSAALKNLLRCSRILKLGFKFQQDLLYLADSFPGSDSKACFHKVEPYVDVEKLYRQIEPKVVFKHRGKDVFPESLSLATICEAVLGAPLCKDMQCSNWEQRPLTTEQNVYAAMDAYCLLAIYEALKGKALMNQSFCQVEKGGSKTFSSLLPKVGIAELLQPTVQKENVGGIVFQRRQAVASSILDLHFANAKASWYRVFESQRMCISMAVQVSPECESSYLQWDSFIPENFQERLLAYGRVEATKSRKKVRSRRARQARREPVVQVDDHVVWHGPPPWDPALGGDGSPKFLCDSMVEGLARQLRCVGIDSAFPHRGKIEARELVEQAQNEGRVLLTRDTKLLRRRLIPPNLAYCVKSLPKQDQLSEIIETFKLTITEDQLLSRCIKCNGDLLPEPLTLEEAVSSNKWDQMFPPMANEEGFLFWQCAVCRHLYWQGQQFHHAMKQFSTICNGLPAM